MIRINLLPITERQSQWPVNKIFIGVSLIFALIFSSIYGYSMYEVWSVEKDLQTLSNKYQALQPTRVLMERANTKKLEFDKKNKIILALTKENQSWYSIIEHLSAQTSPQIWFTDLNKADKNTIQIRGWSTSYPLVADFMKTMENDPFFTEPMLNSVEVDSVNKEATKFDITVKPRGL